MPLVTLATDDSLFQLFCMSAVGLDRSDPAGAFVGRSSLKDMFVSIELEGEIVGRLFGHVGDVSLQRNVSNPACKMVGRKRY